MKTPKTCSYIRETGQPCMSPALRDKDLCYHHQRDHDRRELLRTWRRSGDPHCMEAFELPSLDTPEDVQVAINSLFHSLAGRRLLERDAQFMLDTLRLASRNLRTIALMEENRRSRNTASPAVDPVSPVRDLGT